MIGKWEFLGEAPAVPGLVFRPFRGPDDYPDMASVLNDACASDGVDRVTTPDDIRRNYEHMDNCDPFTDTVFAEIDGRLVAYGRTFWWEENEGPVRYMPFCYIRGEARGRGLGAAMLAHNEARLRQIAAGHTGDRVRTFTVYHSDKETAAQALFEEAGYLPAEYQADMVRADLEDIPDAPMPAGLVVRTPTNAELRKVWDAGTEAFRDHVGAADPTENDYQQALAAPHWDPTLWRVAWDGDEVAGQVRSYIDQEENTEFGRKRGWTENISVRRPYRRRGLARSLLVQSLHAVEERGMEEAALGVHTTNPNGAFELYESVGFRVVRLWTERHKPLD